MKVRLLCGVAPIAMAIALGGSAAQAQQLSLSQATLTSLSNTELQSFIDSTDVVGAALGVSIGGSSFTGGAGYTSISDSTPVTGNTQFRIGSQTKTYTATVILQLVDQGVLSLDSTVGSVLGNVLPTVNGVNYNNVTVSQLLRMNAGLPEFLQSTYISASGATNTLLGAWNAAGNGQLAMTEQQVLNQITAMASTPSAWSMPGGSSPSYSNSNFLLLSLMAEQKTGQSMANLIQNKIITPLGLTNTFLPTSGQAVGLNNAISTSNNNPTSANPNLAHGYYDANAGPGATVTSATPDFVNADPGIPGATGAMVSSARDELVWIKQLATNNANLLSSATQAGRTIFNVNGMPVSAVWAYYGEGIYNVISNTGNQMIGHSGLLSGYQSSVLYEPGTGISIVGNINNSQAFDQSGSLVTVLTLLYNTETAVYRAATANGQCAAVGVTTTCSGTNVAITTQSAGSGQTLHIQQSGQTGLQNTSVLDPSTLEPTANDTTTVPLNTLSYYGLNGAAVSLTGGATLLVDAAAGTEAQISSYGTGSNAVSVSGSGNTLQINGNISAGGANSNAIAVQGSGNAVHLTSTSQLTGNVISTGANTLTMDGGASISTSVGSAVTLAGQTQASLNGSIYAAHPVSSFYYPGTPDTVTGLSVSGSGNTAQIGGSIDTRTTLILYDLDGNPYYVANTNDPYAQAVSVTGGNNRVTLLRGGQVYGNLALSGANTVTLDGTVNGGVTTAAGVWLNGSGSLTGDLSGGGTIAPGDNRAGTLTVGGAFDAANITLKVNYPGQTLHAGTASLTGGAVQAQLPGDVYYPVVSTDQSLSGTFSAVNVSNGTVVYDGRAAKIVTVNPSSAALQSHNAASGANSLAQMLSTHLATERGDGPVPRSQTLAFSTEDGMTKTEALANSLGAAPLSFYDVGSGLGAWASGYATREMNGAIGGAATTDNAALGLSGGLDFTFNNGLRVGGLLGWQSESGHTAAGTQSNGTVDYLGLYGSLPLPGDLTLDTLLLYGRGSANVDRAVSTGGSGTSLARSDQKDNRFAVNARLSSLYQIGDDIKITPYLRFGFLNVQFDGYTESGVGALQVAGARYSEIRPELGGTVSFATLFGVPSVQPRFGVSVGREVVLTDAPRDALVVGLGGPFQIAGGDVSRYVFDFTAGADASLGDSLTGSLDAGTELSPSSLGYKLVGKLRLAF